MRGPTELRQMRVIAEHAARMFHLNNQPILLMDRTMFQYARTIAMLVARQMTRAGTNTIGETFGQVTHPGGLRLIQRAAEKYETDKLFRQHVDALRAAVSGDPEFLSSAS